MNMEKMMNEHKKKELKAIYRFIDKASLEELTSIISEILVCHDNITVFNKIHKSIDKVESVCLNGECIQLNLEN